MRPVLMLSLLIWLFPESLFAGANAKNNAPASPRPTSSRPAYFQRTQQLKGPKSPENKDSLLSIRLPSGGLTFRTFGQWKWAASCRSSKVACYVGSLGTAGNASLFSAPVPPGYSATNATDLCKSVFDFQSKYSTPLPPAMRPRSFSIKSNVKGQSYCSWSRGRERTYFWKAGKSLVSIVFTPLEPGARQGADPREARGPAKPDFLNEVEKFASHVTYDER